jgi:DNA-binding NarL/FixJ family response regulator
MTPGKTTVLIVDDHPILRHGLRQIIESDPAFQLVAEAGDGESALQHCSRLKPDVVLVDIHIPKLNGIALVRAIRNNPAAPPCLILTMNADEGSFNAAMDAGASGYLIKEEALEAVLLGLRTVTTGGIYVSPAASAFLLKRRQRASALKEEKSGLASLTPTENRVLQLVSENKTSREIAAELFISPRTVETHRANLCRKLDLQGANKLLEFAIKNRSQL